MRIGGQPGVAGGGPTASYPALREQVRARGNSSSQRPNTFAQNTFRHPTIPLQSYGGPYIYGQVVRSQLGERVGDLALMEIQTHC
jgi:hypothetical protein